MSLTERAVAALSPPAAGQKFHADGSIPGFGVRVSQGGAKAFVLTVGEERRRSPSAATPSFPSPKPATRPKPFLRNASSGSTSPSPPSFAKSKTTTANFGTKPSGKGPSARTITISGSSSRSTENALPTSRPTTFRTSSTASGHPRPAWKRITASWALCASQ